MSQFAMLQYHQYSHQSQTPLGCPRPGHIETSSPYPRGRNEGLSPPPVSFILFFSYADHFRFFWFRISIVTFALSYMKIAGRFFSPSLSFIFSAHSLIFRCFSTPTVFLFLLFSLILFYSNAHRHWRIQKLQSEQAQNFRHLTASTALQRFFSCFLLFDKPAFLSSGHARKIATIHPHRRTGIYLFGNMCRGPSME